MKKLLLSLAILISGFSFASQENLNLFNSNPLKPTIENVSEQDRVRVGAICMDGWRSYSTGRGTCSHHGGVAYWLYR